MLKTNRYKQLAEKLQKEVTKLKAALKTEFQKGKKEAYTEIDALEMAFAKHMKHAEEAFYKEYAKKLLKKAKNSTTKKTTKTKRCGRSAKK